MRPAPSDTVPAMLTPGEAVLNKEAAELVGRDKIKQINKMGMHMRKAQGFADGDPNVQPTTSPATSRLAGMKGYSASGPAERVSGTFTVNDYMQREAKPIAATTPIGASYRDRAVTQGLMSNEMPSALKPVATGSTLNVHLGDDSGQPIVPAMEGWSNKLQAQADRDAITPTVLNGTQDAPYPHYGPQKSFGEQAAGMMRPRQPQIDLLGEYKSAVGLANGTEMVPKTDTWVDRVKNFGTQLRNNGFAGAMNAATENWEGALGLNKPMSNPNKPDAAPKMQLSGMRFVPTKPAPAQPAIQSSAPKPEMPKDVGGRLATEMDSLMQQKYQGMKTPAQQPAAPAPQAEDQLTGNRVIPAGMRLTSYGAVTPINNPLAYEAERRMAARDSAAQMAQINALIEQVMNPSADDGTFTGMGRAKRQARGARAALSELTGMQKAQMGAGAASADRAANREVTMRGQDITAANAAESNKRQLIGDLISRDLGMQRLNVDTDRIKAIRERLAQEQAMADTEQERQMLEGQAAGDAFAAANKPWWGDLSEEDQAIVNALRVSKNPTQYITARAK